MAERQTSVATATAAADDAEPDQQPARRPSVQERISLFEGKRNEQSGELGRAKGGAGRRLSIGSVVAFSPPVERPILRQWSVVSDVMVDLRDDLSSLSSANASNELDSAPCWEQPGASLASLEDPRPKNLPDIPVQLGSGLGDIVSGNASNYPAQSGTGCRRKGSAISQLRSRSLSTREEYTHLNSFKAFPGNCEATGISKALAIPAEFKSLCEKVQNTGGKSPEAATEVKAFSDNVKNVGAMLSPFQTRCSASFDELGAGRGTEGAGAGGIKGPVVQTMSASHLAGIVTDVRGKFPVVIPQATASLDRKEDHEMEEAPTAIRGTVRSISTMRSHGGSPESGGGQSKLPRQSKSNQERNDDLRMKADALEALFAAQKLRFLGDHSGVGGQSIKLIDEPPALGKRSALQPCTLLLQEKVVENPVLVASRNLGGGIIDFDSRSMNVVDSQDCGECLHQLPNVDGPSVGSTGSFYERYMQKREAKIRHESAEKRAQKNEKMKAMQDILERNCAEMKANFANTAGKKHPAFRGSGQGKPVQENAQGALRPGDQRDAKEIVDELRENTENKFHRHDVASIRETQQGPWKTVPDVASSKFSQGKKPLHKRSLSLTTPRTGSSAASVKPLNVGAAKHWSQAENPLSQPVASFSDFKKENTKPSKVTTNSSACSQVGKYSCSKSIDEEIFLVRVDKQQRLQSIRKSCVGLVEDKDGSVVNNDTTALTPLRFSKEESQQNTSSRIVKNGHSKPFLPKGKGIGPGVGPGIAKLKEPRTEGPKNEENANLVEKPDYLVGPDKCEEWIEGASIEVSSKSASFQAHSENGIDLSIQESKRSRNFGLENNDSLPSSFPAYFNHLLTTKHGPQEESAASWNSHAEHPLSVGLEVSDVDVSVDLPFGSLPLWNSHHLSQREPDSARMRKKWESTQKPILVASAAMQPRKDVTKGFKRLLMFGRKSRGSENLVADSVSASTASEGDEDNEDVNALENRSSEDLRKSRMGLLQCELAGNLPDGF